MWKIPIFQVLHPELGLSQCIQGCSSGESLWGPPKLGISLLVGFCGPYITCDIISLHRGDKSPGSQLGLGRIWAWSPRPALSARRIHKPAQMLAHLPIIPIMNPTPPNLALELANLKFSLGCLQSVQGNNPGPYSYHPSCYVPL